VVGSKIPTAPMDDCTLAFDIVETIHLEKLERLNILKPEITSQNFDNLMGMPSTLGMDILSRFRVCFDGLAVTLEK